MMATGKLNTIISQALFGKKNSSDTEYPILSDTDIRSVMECCRDEIRNSEDSGIMPSPKFFEQAAVLSRKERNYANEIAICDMYVNLAKQYASKNKLTRQEFIESVLPQCAPLYKRMHNAKSMLPKTHLE
jgi:hypothetical protein